MLIDIDTFAGCILFLLELFLVYTIARLHSVPIGKQLLYLTCYCHLVQRKATYGRWPQLSVFDNYELHNGPQVEKILEEVPLHVHSIDVERCIYMHNRIVEHALERLPRPPLDKFGLDWFQLVGDQAERVRHRLSAPMIHFLEGIYVWDFDHLSLTPHLRGVGTPYHALPEHMEDFFPNSIVLYSDNDLEDGRGLIFDMTRNLVRCYGSMFEMVEEDHLWIPLETALEYYWSEIQNHRYVVDGSETDPYYEPVGWRRANFTHNDVSKTIRIWDAYVSLVESRSGLDQQMTADQHFSGLVREDLIHELPIGTFAQSMLRHLRKPRFKNIAPRLQVIDDDLVFAFLPTLQRQAEMRPEERVFSNSFILFPSSVRAGNPNIRERDKWKWFHWQKHLQDDRCGIYLASYSERFADEVITVGPMKEDNITVLHFANPYERVVADLLDIEEEDIARACETDPPPLRLYELIALWYDKVARGEWSVGAEGVEGGFEDLWAGLP